MKIFITTLILFLGMSIDISAQTTMSESKKVDVATPSVAQSSVVTIVRPTVTVKPTLSTAHRGAKNSNTSGKQSEELKSPNSTLRSKSENAPSVSTPIIRKKKN